MRYFFYTLYAALLFVGVLACSEKSKAVSAPDHYYLKIGDGDLVYGATCIEGVVYILVDRSATPKYLPGKSVPETCPWPVMKK